MLGIPGTSMDEIKTVYSHPQALAQCKKYLESHPDWKIVKTENTAGAAKKVHEEMNKTQAAIASRAAGELYGLSVMAENICYNDQNVTRFIIVSAHPVYEKSAAKVSVCFELPHESGTLVQHAFSFYLQRTEHDQDRVPSDHRKEMGISDFL